MAAVTSNARSSAWHEEPKGEAHFTALAAFAVVRDESEWRVDADDYHASLYLASEQTGIKSSEKRGYEYGPCVLPYNLCSAATDTLQAKIAQHRPLPQVLTQRGNWTNQKRARKMTQFLEGQFDAQRIHEEHGPMMVRDALIFGRGILKITVDSEGEIVCDRMFPWECFVDEYDAKYGKPRNFYVVRSMDKRVATATFARSDSGKTIPKLASAIRDGGKFNIARDYELSAMSTVDRLDVLEAWHLPSYPGAKDGRHVVVIQGATLVDEPWEYDYFPFVILQFQRALQGIWGQGLVEQLEGYQYEINQAAEKTSEMHQMSGVKVLVPDGSDIHRESIRNGLHLLHHKPGMPPQVWQMDLVNEHTRARARELWEDGLNRTGLSQMSVQSQRPQGISAAIALQTLDDVETERFLIFGRAYEAWCLEIGRRFIDCAKQIAKEHGDLAVSVPMRGGILDLNWKDVFVDGTKLRIFSTGILPTQIPARLDRLKDLWNTGLIDRATFLRYLDAPDLQAELDLETADRLVIDEVLEAMRDAEEDEGEQAYIPPSAYQALEWGSRRAQQMYNRALLDGAPEFVTERFQRFIEDSKKELEKLKAAAMPPANDTGAAALQNAPLTPGGMAPAGPAMMPPPGPPPGMAA